MFNSHFRSMTSTALRAQSDCNPQLLATKNKEKKAVLFYWNLSESLRIGLENLINSVLVH